MTSYECICMVCGKSHTMKARFAPNTMRTITKDNKEYVLMSCGNHTSKEIIKANKECQSM